MVKKNIIKFLLKILYRVKVDGMENYNKVNDKVLYVINPSSLLDPILLSAFLPRKISYIVDKAIAKRWYMRPIVKFANVIEVDFNAPSSTKKIIQALEEHAHCMVFHDKLFDVDQELMRIYEITAFIVAKTGASLLPIRIDGAQYSPFSYFQHQISLQRFPKINIHILPPQTVELQDNLSIKGKRKELASKLHALMTELNYQSQNIDRSILDMLRDSVHIHGKNKIIAEDADLVELSYKNLFIKGYALGGALHNLFPNEKYIGFLLPNSLAAIVAFTGLQFHRHVPAMLNFTSGITPVLAACHTVQVKVAITSRKFIDLAELKSLEQALLDAGIKLIYLEDVAKAIPLSLKIRALVNTFLVKVPKIDPSEPCAVLYTSGSEGKPKAVLMSHKNAVANHAQMLSVIVLTSEDKFFNCLPMFHTFGLTVGTLLPLLRGMRVFMYPSPLHYRIVPHLFYESGSTILVGTDTFLTGYARYGKPYEFFNVRYMIAGAEKLRESTANTYRNNFNVGILEGYGATETSPVLSVNTRANKREGSVGKLFPGIEYKLEPVEGVETGGSLNVKGGNIMLGYMYYDKPGVLVPPHEGWHDLGDIVDVDSENYIFIKGRAKRFAKLGGEMVSLTAVEQAIEPLLSENTFGIVSIPDEKKGEVIVLIVENSDISSPQISAFLAKSGLPALWTPKKILNMKTAPVLGTGKFDYVKAKELALAS